MAVAVAVLHPVTVWLEVGSGQADLYAHQRVRGTSAIR